uniref:uncharacterized protein LOC127067147 isoform X2 n=1 Tax=Vespula vulgaris TaxID=7454 RepID=UPI00213ADEE9|nr:uncharacterized protein LOC127067147 isoform X2 [Vespula vulgaris]
MVPAGYKEGHVIFLKSRRIYSIIFFSTCNIWGNVCPRICRRPRIGDIPKYDAVDEESPGSSSKKLTVSPSETDKNLPLEIPLESKIESSVYPLPVTSSRGEIYPGSRIIEQKRDDKTLKCQVERSFSRTSIGEILDPYELQKERRDIIFNTDLKNNESIIEKQSSVPIGNIFDDLEKRSESHRERITKELHDPKWRNTSSLSSDNVRIPSSPEETSDSEIVEVRKDSALFLEEAEGFDQREFARRYSSLRFARPRRESSGYSSNLGTFDEDRRNSTNVDVLQDLLKERRRSSAKRNNSRFGEDESRYSIVSSNNNNVLERMPTTEIHRKLSSSGLEMPDIEEVKELVKDDSTSSLSQENLDGVVENQQSRNPSILSTNETSTTTTTPTILATTPTTAITTTTIRSCDKSFVSPSSCRTMETTGRTIVCDPYDSTSLKEAIAVLATKREEDVRSNAMIRNSSSNSSSSSSSNRGRESNNDRRTFESVREESRCDGSTREKEEEDDDDEKDDEEVEMERRRERRIKMKSIEIENREFDSTDILSSRSSKVYRFISTQSEDRVDERLENIDVCPKDRRISLEITRGEEEERKEESGRPIFKLLEKSRDDVESTRCTRIVGSIEDDKGNDANNIERVLSRNVAGVAALTAPPQSFRKLSSAVGELGSGCGGSGNGGGIGGSGGSGGSSTTITTTHRLLSDVAPVSVRPIYPYCPYSPYGSPQGSPRNRRRPLRESRRVSIDNTQGGLQLNQYRLLDNIGQGSYGIVKLAYNEEDDTHYAMKILSKRKLMKKAGIFGRMAPGRKGTADPLAKVYREIALLKKLDHPNVVKLVEVLDDPDEDNLYLVFELVQKGEVLQIPTDKPLDEDTARKNFRDVVMGIEYLHYQRIVHRDIKPSNLLVDSDGRIKIADLGVSAELRASGELLSGPAGTPAFAAPETTMPDAHYSGTSCDVWSMGVTLYSLVTGRVPWDGAGSIIGVQAAIRSEPLKFPECPKLSKDLQDLIVRMLTKEPTERISLQRLKEHDWLTNTGKDPLPSEADNCRLPVTVTDEEVERVVTKVPKLDTLILVKKMLKQHSFQNPFLPKKIGRTLGNDGDPVTESSLPLGRTTESLVQRSTTTRNIKTERFQRSGRSNSAPDSYDWQANNRQISMESPLPPVTEASNQEAEIERR